MLSVGAWGWGRGRRGLGDVEGWACQGYCSIFVLVYYQGGLLLTVEWGRPEYYFIIIVLLYTSKEQEIHADVPPDSITQDTITQVNIKIG